MDHVAIMKKSWKLIDKILSREKTIESRWYQSRRAPWNSIAKGDRVFFKDSGEPITAVAYVTKVEQIEIQSLHDAQTIVDQYAQALHLVQKDTRMWKAVPKYCILIHLAHPRRVPPFLIGKAGFGCATAWLTVSSIETLRLTP